MSYEEQICAGVEARYPHCPKCGEPMCTYVDEYEVVRCIFCDEGICLCSQQEERFTEEAYQFAYRFGIAV